MTKYNKGGASHRPGLLAHHELSNMIATVCSESKREDEQKREENVDPPFLQLRPSEGRRHHPGGPSLRFSLPRPRGATRVLTSPSCRCLQKSCPEQGLTCPQPPASPPAHPPTGWQASRPTVTIPLF